MTTNEFYNELQSMNLSSEDLINIICDYFDSNVFEGLFEHIKEEFNY